MSSKHVRTEFKAFIVSDIPAENLIDLTGQYKSLKEVIKAAGLQYTDPWLGLQFIGSNDDPTTLSSTNTTGRFREEGAFFLHIVEPVQDDVVDDILDRVETLRNLLRGRRINDIVIESVVPPNFESGATLELEAGYQSASVIANYYRDLTL